MRIGIKTGHAYSHLGGGFQALKWHILAMRALGHDVDVYTTNNPSEGVLQNWFDGVPLRFYMPHVERDYSFFLNLDHFSNALPEAKLNACHVFFPMRNVPIPGESVRIYSNSAYTARYIESLWGRVATPMYIPIDGHFAAVDKQNIILHVSRFSEPSEYADKAHRQMIQAFKMISRVRPGWKLVLAGSIDPMQQHYFSELQRLGAGFNIDLVPNLSNQELIKLYGRSAIYWHATGVSLPTIPSAQEHMGIAPLEAQASGCVPIVYDSGGMPEVVLNGQTGLLFDTVHEMADKTLALTQNWHQWAAMSQAGQVWASSWSDFDNFVSRIDDMLNDRPIGSMNIRRRTSKYSYSDVTAVIPTYNSVTLDKCIRSLSDTAPGIKIVVINNGNDIPNLEYPDTVVYNTGENLGFAGANRFSEDKVSTPLVFMCNDDVEAIYPNWLEQLLLIASSDKVGVVGPKLLFPNGHLQYAGGCIDWNRDDIGYHRLYGQIDGSEASTPIETDFVTGAALLCKRELFHMPDDLIGFLNYEDTWIAMESRDKGLKVVYQPSSCMIHAEGQTKKRTEESSDKVKRAAEIFRARWQGVR